jgi:glycosyltransferase involved in cell wall biosynthesis
MWGGHDILFYLKASPASRWFMKLRSMCGRRCAVVGTMESQSNWQDDSISPRAVRLFEGTILRCDYLFSNSESVRRSLETNYRITSQVIPTGVDTEFFTPNWSKPPSLRPRVLFVGSLRSFKGPQVVLDAAERHRGADFIIVGDGPMAGELKRRAKNLPNVAMMGSLARSAVREQYRNADIFFFPSRWEGSPRVLMEAAASGLPAVAQRSYQPESVIDGETGYLDGDDEQMMDRLGTLIAQPGLRLAFGKSARQHIAKFNWDLITRRWEAAFERIARTAHGPKDFHS